MGATLREIETRLLAVMPIESTINRASHAQAVASVVFEARRQAARQMEAHIARVRAHYETTAEWTRLVNDRMRERGSATR